MSKPIFCFKIIGLDAKTGDQKVLYFNAESEYEAVSLASESGVFTEKAEQIGLFIKDPSNNPSSNSMYEYMMVQIPPGIVVQQDHGNAAATYLQNIVNKHAAIGWEFFRVDPIIRILFNSHASAIWLR